MEGVSTESRSLGTAVKAPNVMKPSRIELNRLRRLIGSGKASGIAPMIIILLTMSQIVVYACRRARKEPWDPSNPS